MTLRSVASGSVPFEEITQLEEYNPTRVEDPAQRLCEAIAAPHGRRRGPGRGLDSLTVLSL